MRRLPTVLARSAAKQIAKLPDHLAGPCHNALREIQEGRLLRGKDLKGKLSPFRSVSIGRGYRLIYRETAETVQVVDIGPRRGLFRH